MHGKERDEETGLAYHKARYYATWLGRWTAADPIGLAGGTNRYAYSNNDPIGFSDPSGQIQRCREPTSTPE
ncbi:RHS repeat-associated core domain-containing protein [Nannocystis pusilla]|uniref:RHS repeat-associated core domain-containing protein n=1 Tax=Nannocystis pusilla TaxID=889268 RepID=UPI003B82874D